MPGTNTPGQMYTHELNAKKGWPSPYALDYAAEYKSTVTGVKGGMVISLDSNGQFVKGLSANSAMPIFALQNQSDFDVTTDVGNIMGGVGSGLVATGAYELQTTEFVADTYAPNDTLTVENNSSSANYGKLKKGTVNTDPIVGVVSSGQSNSPHDNSISLLSFWPVYCPVP